MGRNHLLAAAVAPLFVIGTAAVAPAVSASTSVAASTATPYTIVKLINRQTGKCLTVAGGVSTDNNHPLVQYTCDHHPSRYWILQPGSNGGLQIKNVQTRKCV